MKNAWDCRIPSERKTQNQRGSNMMGVNDVRPCSLYYSAAAGQNRGESPQLTSREIELGSHDLAADAAIFRSETPIQARKRDNYFDSETQEDAHLFQDPCCAKGSFDDVENLHGHSLGEAYLTAPVWTIRGGGGK